MIFPSLGTSSLPQGNSTMVVHRAFLYRSERDGRSEAELVLDRSESHHLNRVRRAREGERVDVLDGRGEVWQCTLSNPHPTASVLRVHAHTKTPPPRCPVVLALATPKSKAMHLAIQKATELGVSLIQPLKSDRAEVHLSPMRAETRLRKWRTTAVEACKQCGNPFLPGFAEFKSVHAFVAHEVHNALKLMGLAGEPAGALPALLRNRMYSKIIWLIGPEGGFTESECEVAISAGFRPISLGLYTLRTETAALAALAVTAQFMAPLDRPYRHSCFG